MNTKKDAKTQNKWQKVEQAKGRPLLQWVGKQPLESVQYYPAQEKEVYGDKKATDFNKLFWGDNLQVLSHLLKEHRGKVDLIYIDPPFDSKADYVKRVKIRGEKIGGAQQSILEEAQYTDIWERDEYLQFMYERLLLLKELLSDTGSIYLHCDWHRNSYLRLIMDEVFGPDNMRDEVIWHYPSMSNSDRYFPRKHDTILFYSKNADYYFNAQAESVREKYAEGTITRSQSPAGFNSDNANYLKSDTKLADTVWTISHLKGKENIGYPTQKPEKMLRRIIEASSKEGDTVLDCFVGSGTTCAVAQQLGRKWIGCDINIGAIQTTSKRLNQIIDKQKKEKDADFKGSLAFKVLNVNEYDVFKNELEAKEIVMEMYGVEPIKRSYFDGVLDTDFVKIISLNRVLNKMDIRSILKGTEDAIDQFTKKTTTKHSEAVYSENVVIICSGMELDAHDYLKKENKTGVDIKVYDILNDTKELIFKQYPESKMKVSSKGKKLTVEIQEFYSPLLMRRLEMENEKMLKKERQAKVKDFKQTIDSVAIDVDYDGKLFNAEVMDLPDKKEVIAGTYEWEYNKKGKNTVAVKIIDVLGEEYFETFEVEVK